MKGAHKKVDARSINPHRGRGGGGGRRGGGRGGGGRGGGGNPPYGLYDPPSAHHQPQPQPQPHVVVHHHPAPSPSPPPVMMMGGQQPVQHQVHLNVGPMGITAQQYPAFSFASPPPQVVQQVTWQQVGPQYLQHYVAPNFVPQAMSMQPPPGPPQVHYAPFEVTEERAKQIFASWKDARWFAPSDFSKLKEGNLYAFLVPYYEFNATLNSTYSGKVGYQETSTVSTVSGTYNGQHHGRHNHNRGAANHTNTHVVSTRWQPGQGAASNTFSNMLVCATVVGADKPILSEIGKWNLSKVVSTHNFEGNVGPAIDWQKAWASKLPSIRQKQKNKCQAQLKRDFSADVLENFSINTQLTQLNYRLTYFPVYYYGYTYEDKEYKFFINGQNGQRKGDRPYGIGFVGRVFGQIGGLFTGGSAAAEATKRVSGGGDDSWKPAVQKAPRSIIVKINNQTSLTLTNSNKNVRFGNFALAAPEQIPPQSQGQFVVCANIFAGTEGDIEFTLLENNAVADTFKIDWKNPLIGSKNTTIRAENRQDGRFRIVKTDERLDHVLELTIDVIDKLPQ